MQEHTRWVPLMIVHNDIVLPGTNAFFEIHSEHSIAAVRAALEHHEDMMVVLSKDKQLTELTDMEQLYGVGTLVSIKQIFTPNGGGFRANFVGLNRGKINALDVGEEYAKVLVTDLIDDKCDMDALEEEAYIHSVRDLLRQCESLNMRTSISGYSALYGVKDLATLTDMVGETMMFNTEVKQQLVEEYRVKERTKLLYGLLEHECEIKSMQNQLEEKLRSTVKQNQKDYILREQLRSIQQELGDVDDPKTEGEQFMERLANIQAPAEVQEKLSKEIKRYKGLSYSSSESAVLRNYIETLLDYPWSVFTEDDVDLSSAIEQLEADHYGLETVKERIIDYLAVRILGNRKDAPILCLVGPPGTGKTSIAYSIATALHKPYARIALGGVRDEAEIRGHRKTYVGAMPGRIVTAVSKTKVNNPLLLLDEIDKVGKDQRGDTSSALLEVLDGEQNIHFVDHYFEVPVDLSGVFFIATANDASAIPDALRDRMELIEVSSYTEQEKFHIAKEYLVRKQLQKNGLKARQFQITEEGIYKLIRNYTREAGVRGLERRLSQLMEKAARGILCGEFKALRVTPKKIPELLGVEKYQDDLRNLENRVGVVTGLAWTRVGGDTLNVEVNLLDGKGGLLLTGNLGDVMKESAQIALSYVRTLQEVKKLPEDYFDKHVVHVHVPEGATPKDGPSAGVTMALAIYSALLNRPVAGDLAMTGEITLKGRVLPIGGLKEKLLAAQKAGKTRVLIPVANRRKVESLEAEILQGLSIEYVEDMKEVIEKGVVKRSFQLRPSKEM